MVAYPDRCAGNDPKLFFFLGGGGGGREGGEGGSRSPPRLNIFTVGNMGVMIRLGQGGLHSLSAYKYYYYYYLGGGSEGRVMRMEDYANNFCVANFTKRHKPNCLNKYCYLLPVLFKMAGGIEMGSIAISVSVFISISASISPYISVGIKASFLKLEICWILQKMYF